VNVLKMPWRYPYLGSKFRGIQHVNRNKEGDVPEGSDGKLRPELAQKLEGEIDSRGDRKAAWHVQKRSAGPHVTGILHAGEIIREKPQ